VELSMTRAGLHGPRKSKLILPKLTTAGDLVKRDFARELTNQLWVTDITEHPTREGEVCCCVVLDMYSRKVGVNRTLVSPNAPQIGCSRQADRGVRTDPTIPGASNPLSCAFGAAYRNRTDDLRITSIHPHGRQGLYLRLCPQTDPPWPGNLTD
jgi:hypothetical protein